MFESLTDKLELTFKRLRGQGKITETNIDDALRDVRLALLEADVHLQVVKSFLESVKTKAMGQEVLQSLTPEQQFIGIVRDELVNLLGGDFRELDLKTAPPVVIMLVGLQGSGKTTTLAKLARYLKKEKKRSPYLVPADIYRPAAIEQLKILGNELELPVYDSDPKLSAVTLCQRALEEAKKKFCDVLLIDTAGRLHIDEELMQELASIKDAVRPHQILFVADSMTGQDAVNQALGFDAKLALSGIILTKLDGDARGGAGLDCRSADLVMAHQREQRREGFHALLEQRLDRFRRHVAAGKAGAADGDDYVYRRIGDPGFHLRADLLHIVGHDRARRARGRL